MNQEKFWIIFGKISAIIVTVAAVVTIIAFVYNKSPNLSISCSQSELSLPPKIVETIDKNLSAQFFYDSLSKAFPNADKSLLQDISKDLARSFLDIKSDYSSLSLKDRYIVFIIKNNGKSIASNAYLNISTSGEYKYTSFNNEVILGEFKDTVKLGDIRPGTTVKVEIWSLSPIFEGNISYLEGKKDFKGY